MSDIRKAKRKMKATKAMEDLAHQLAVSQIQLRKVCELFCAFIVEKHDGKSFMLKASVELTKGFQLKACESTAGLNTITIEALDTNGEPYKRKGLLV